MRKTGEQMYFDELIDKDIACHYCGEPLKECDTIIPGVGVIPGEVDLEEFQGQYWHSGCIDDWLKENCNAY